MKKVIAGTIILVILISIPLVFMALREKNKKTNVTTITSNESVAQQEITVAITNNGFEPQTITIKSGTKVIWVNKSNAISGVYSPVYPEIVYQPLNLGKIDIGESVSLIFDKPGTYTYHNKSVPPLPPFYTGTVIVK